MNGKILIVDDSPADIFFLTKIMKNHSYDFDSVKSIKECEEYLKEEIPTAIILDYLLPDGDSLSIVEKHHSRIPIILLTGMEDPNIGLDAVKKGAQDFLIKGSINAELLDKSLNYSTERQSLKNRVASTQKMATLGRMSSGIAHEMNTPIQYISDNLYFLEKEFSTVLSKLQRISDSSKSMNKDEFHQNALKELAEIDLEFLNSEIPDAVTQSLQGMGKISKLVKALKNFAVNETTQTKKLDINKVISSVISKIQSEAADIMEVKFAENTDLRNVLAEEHNVKQVLNNILENSVYELRKIYDSTQISGVVNISTVQNGRVLEIRISDSGPGIPEDIIDHIFDPFFTTKSFQGSLGQGLAVAHRLVHEVFGGTLKVKSQEGEGVEFVITIPNRTL